MSKGIGGHQSPKMQKDEWLTPPELIRDLGEFDLDPCAPINRPRDTAKVHYTILDDGLKQEWFGRVWLNPPYGKETGKWLKRLVEHGNGIALIANEFLADDWEIIWDKVDFWTAWQAYKEGKKISCELWEDLDTYYYQGMCLTESEINAKWIILN